MASALHEMGALVREHGIRAVFFVYPNSVRGEDPEVPRRIARDSGFTCVDLHSAFQAYYKRTGRSFRDVSLSRTDQHPNAEGHRLMAEALLGPVREALTARRLPQRGSD